MSDTPEKPKKKRQASVTIAELRTRALAVTPAEVQAYEPTAHDVAIVEAMLGGNVLLADIAREADLPPELVSAALRDPTRCAWLCQTVSQHVQYRIGLVDASMLNRAIAGSERAAEVIYRRFDALQQVNRSEVSTEAHLEKLTNAELKQLVIEAAVRLGAKDADFKVIEKGTADADRADPGT